MDRRKSLKLLATGALAGTAVAVGAGCNDSAKESTAQNSSTPTFNLDRNNDELAYEQKLLDEADYFTEHEMKTITVLSDIIIPKDEVSGSASEAGVPAFIAFIVKDMPQHKIPLKGGLRWLDMQSLQRFGKSFVAATQEQRIELVDLIAYPEEAPAEMKQGVAFFNLMRNLTITGFYTSEIGIKDLGYAGNKPNKWNGVPPEVLQQFQLSYTDKELKECIRFE
jgi:gluconate 2-dehydrogenase gamma chain